MVIKRSKRNPKVGDLIEHTCKLNGKFQGKVTQLLGMQFVYKTIEGHDRFCLFREDWNYIDRLPKKKK